MMKTPLYAVFVILSQSPRDSLAYRISPVRILYYDKGLCLII